ncbi:Subtilisin-like protease SBT1.7 [Linum grandiflorum]
MKAAIIFLCFYVTYVVAATSDEARSNQKSNTYIIHMDQTHKPETFDDHEQWYGSSLKTVSQSADILYTYNTLIHGYSATLTAEEAESLEKQLGVLSVLPETVYQLHTTRSPLFLGLEQKAQQSDLLPASTSVSEVTVGVLDTGVWPELESFNDKGLGPVPTTWKGTCEVGKKFDSTKCNKKLIGARYFSKGYEAAYGPVDESYDDGHGSHTSTTAAGSVVSGANLFGFATGTARGMAPQARVAVYKVCWLGGCFGSDILAAMEKAVEDGVNVISMSIGGGLSDYYRDTVSIGAFSAAAQGIFVSCSAGNGGPSQGSLSNVAPWITTVGAGTLDRNFPAYVTLGNGNNFTGTSLYSGKPLPADTLIPLVYAANASDSVSGNLCQSDSLIRSKVSGKIVICDRVQKSGGIGMILSNTELFGEELVADSHLIPSSAVGQKVGDAIKKYASSDPKPTATISSGGTHVGIEPSPVVAAFSSRGPNLVTPEILKPDVIAPGVNILAGWTGAVGPTGLANDTRSVSFNIISGTSMSCPHVSGLAALIKAAHQDWSPAAIRSALMTTAYTAYKTGKPATPFDYGAGHVNPVAALDPGLVYDATVEDYFGFLCALNYTAELIKRATNKGFTCDSRKTYSLGDFNYPSFSVALQTASGKGGGGSGSTMTVKYSRTLTNVGSPGTYKVALASETKAVKMTVQPATLTFGQEKEKKSYTVTFTAASMPSGTTSFAHLEWSDGKHMVHSPIAFTWA